MKSAAGFSQSADFFCDKPVHKFQKAYEGQQLEHVFRITNTGEVPLIISDYHVACECTKAHLPEKPIAPGASFDLKVTFDTKGKYYFQDRLIMLKTNTAGGQESLRIKVNVVPKNE
jgi:hypothetical protein